MIYLAGPYTHPDPFIRHLRHEQLRYAAGQLMACGYHVYSPITHGHPVAEVCDLPTEWDYWMHSCLHHIGHCSQVVVLELDGWDDSVGVCTEIETARVHGVPVNYLPWGELL